MSGYELSALAQFVLPGGAGTLLAVAVLSVLRGWLVPRSVLRDAQADRDYWRETAMAALTQNQQLMEQGRVVRDVMQALPAPEEGRTR
jgi:hypothetical protein